MATVSVHIPQIGEGLQEARLVAVLKQPGERVKRDEPLYQMETDKAVMDVESPYEGTLVAWLANPEDVLPIGAPVATMDVEGAVETAPPHQGNPVSSIAAAAEATPTSEPLAPQNLAVPPRTRAYAHEKGLSDAEIAALVPAGTRLMPADVDAYLAGRSSSSSNDRYEEHAVPPKQRLLNSRMVRGMQQAVPGTISVAVEWENIHAERLRLKESGDAFQPSAFTMFAYAVARAAREFAAVRTAIVSDDRYRTYKSISLGIAVALPGDELVLAVVEEADQLSWQDFANRMRAQIDLARQGKDQAHEGVTLSLTNMQNFGLRDAVPVVVPPAMGTLFLGEVYHAVAAHKGSSDARRYANIALTFDHRVMNGVGAAQFAQAVRKRCEEIVATLAEAGE